MTDAGHDSDFNYVYKEGYLYVGGVNSSVNGNGAFNKSIVEAILPIKFQNNAIYGTTYKCLSNIQTLKKVFVPRTYKLISADFCWLCRSLESIVFEENSNIKKMGGWIASATSIRTFTFPSNIKTLRFNRTFWNCYNLEAIYYPLAIECDSNSIFDSITPSKITVYTRVDYKFNTFCGAAVVKALTVQKRYYSCKQKQRRLAYFALSICVQFIS